MIFDDYKKNSYMNTYVSDNEQITLISKIMFSEKNIDKIQNKIIKKIKKKYNYTISKQSNEILLNIMKSIFNNNVTYSYSNKKELVEELQHINNLIIEHCVEDIKKNIDEHNIYLKKINNDFCMENVIPWDTNGKNVSNKGNNSLQPNHFI